MCVIVKTIVFKCSSVHHNFIDSSFYQRPICHWGVGATVGVAIM